MKTITRYQKQCIEENNEAREANGIETIKIKIRKCNVCSSEFESSCRYSCPACRRKKERAGETVDLRAAQQFDW